ncbi:MAG: hypothetical protein BWY83_01706 [bacterium ADurb.Bin478]|nr:MAG: hypothetical protein BWY83_01706 [bacterium ADurb.Bin478]
MSSLFKLRGTRQSDQALECEATTGCLLCFNACTTVRSWLCDRSMIMPRSFMALITSTPKPDKPSKAGCASLQEMHHSLLAAWMIVISRTPR